VIFYKKRVSLNLVGIPFFNVLKSNYLKTCPRFFILWWCNKNYESCVIPEPWQDVDWIFHHVCMDWNPDHGCLKIKQIKGLCIY